MSIKSTIKKVASKVSTAVKNVASKITGSSQSGAVLKARVGENMTPAQTTKAYQTIGSTTGATKSLAKSSGGMTYVPNAVGGMTYVPPSPSNGGMSYVPTSKISSTSKGGSSSSSLSDSYLTNTQSNDALFSGLSSTFSSMGAPTNANTVASFGGTSSPSIPNIGYQTPDISNARAESAAMKKYNEMQYADEQAQAQTEQDRLTQENKGLLGQLLNKKEEVADVRKDYEKYYQVAAQQAKVESMTKDFNALVASRDQQIAEIIGSPYGTMDFTNNRLAQIERNAAPKINQLSADLKFETALLTQKQELVSQAVDDFFKEETRNLQLYQLYMEENSDIIERLDKKEQTAIAQAFELKKMQLDEARDMRTMVANLAFENPTAGINPFGDTPQQALSKAAKIGVGVKVSESSTTTNKLTPAQTKTYEAYKSQISTYKSKDEAIKDLEKNKFGIIKAIGQAGYDSLVADIYASTLPDKKESFWNRLFN